MAECTGAAECCLPLERHRKHSAPRGPPLGLRAALDPPCLPEPLETPIPATIEDANWVTSLPPPPSLPPRHPPARPRPHLLHVFQERHAETLPIVITVAVAAQACPPWCSLASMVMEFPPGAPLAAMQMTMTATGRRDPEACPHLRRRTHLACQGIWMTSPRTQSSC